MKFSRGRAGRRSMFFCAVLMCSICAVCVAIAVEGQTAAPAQVPAQARPAYPTRGPHEAGYVTAKELPDGANAPAGEDGNFILSPTHTAAPEMADDMLQGTVVEFTMNSEDSRLYPGIARDPHTQMIRPS
jgi:enterochelin esterase family protein